MSEVHKAVVVKPGLIPDASPCRTPSPTRAGKMAVERIGRPRKSSAALLLRHATGWAGNDLEQRLKELQDMRGGSVF